MKKEYINLAFNMAEHKQEEINGIPIGIIKGYLATWDIDRGNDKFIRGAFMDSIREHLEKGRPIRLLAQHYSSDIIGGFPIEKVFEDEKGLFVEGHINLNVQKGAEFYALALQGILSDLSIGYSADDVLFEDGIRKITKATIWEGSIVSEPMNTEATISEVKVVNARSILAKDFAGNSVLWDAEEAEKRIRSWAGSENDPNEQYKSAFMYYDSEKEDSFDGYNLLVTDIIEGKAQIVPRAVFNARAILSGVKGGIDISSTDKEHARTLVNTLYKEMGLDEPFVDGKAKPFCLTEIKSMRLSILANILRHKELSKDASVYAARSIFCQMAKDTSDESELKKGVADVTALIRQWKTKK
jgi:HK97 family phage prohead protease